MKRYSLVYTKTAAEDIRKLDGSVKKRLLNILRRLADDPERGKPLSGELKGLRSYRGAAYRIIYKIEHHRLLVVIIAIGHRKNIYDRVKQAIVNLGS